MTLINTHAIPVKQAKKIKTCSIVSFDWLEDSLMKFTAKRVKPYLLKVVTKERARAKVESKQLRDEDIKTGGKFPTTLPYAPP